MRNLFPIIFIAVAVGVFFLFGKPINTDITNLRAEVSQYNDALSNATGLEKTRDSLLDIYNNKISQEEKVRLDRFLPNTANNIELILEIQKLTDTYNLPLQNIKFDSAVINGNSQNATAPNPNQVASPESILPYGVFNLEFETEGTFETFSSFTRDLDRNLRLINVKSISFSSPTPVKGTAQDPNFYKFDVKIETYWLKS